MRRRIVTTTLAIGVGFVALWALAWFGAGGEVPRNTRVLGFEVGARSRAGAAVLLERHFSADVAKPIVIDTVGQLHDVSASDLGATFDVAATIAAAGSRPVDPIKLFKRTFSKVDLQPEIKVDLVRFNQVIDDLGKRSAVATHEGAVIFKGLTPIPILPLDGQSIDGTKALDQFTSQWLRSSPIKVPIIVRHALVTADEVERTIRYLASPSVSEPITLVIDGHDLLLAPKDIASSMTFVPDAQGHLTGRFSSDALELSLGSAWLKLVPPAKDATLKFINEMPRVYPAVLGRMISDDSLTQGLTPVLTATGPARRAFVSTSVEQPRITTEEIGGLGINVQITKFTTQFPPAAYRIQNIHRAADLIDGTLVKPGEIFSLNKTVGQRTAANGFAEGIVIYNGRFAKDFGGGVSQVATTTWNAAWFAGVELVSHMAHSFYISRYPAGREATVAWPNVDLQFRNDTGHVLLMQTTYTNSSVSISIYGTRKYTVETITGPRRNFKDFATYDDDSPTCISQGGVLGFDIDVTRVLKLAGVEASREVFHTHYVPEDRINCTNPAATFGNPPIKAPAKPKATIKPSPKPIAVPTVEPSQTVTPTPSPTMTPQ